MTNLNNVSFGNAAVAVQSPVKAPVKVQSNVPADKNEPSKEEVMTAAGIISIIGVAGLLAAHLIKGKGVQVPPKAVQEALPEPKIAGALEQKATSIVDDIMDRYNKFPKSHNYDSKSAERVKQAADKLSNLKAQADAAPIAREQVKTAEQATKYLDALKAKANITPITREQVKTAEQANQYLNSLEKGSKPIDAVGIATKKLESIKPDETVSDHLAKLAENVTERKTASGIILPDAPVKKAAAKPQAKIVEMPKMTAEEATARLQKAAEKKEVSVADHLAELAQKQKPNATQSGILLSA